MSFLFFCRHENSKIIEHSQYSLEDPPHDKGPCCTVPEPAERENNKDVQNRTGSAAAVSAERNIDIACEETAECDVPAAPDFTEIAAFIGRIKVDGKINAEHFPEADGHITVSAEIKVELECIGEHHKGGGPELKVIDLLEAEGDNAGERVGKKAFFGKPENEDIDTLPEPLFIRPSLRKIRKLRHHFIVEHDWSGDQLREEGNERDIVQQRIVRCPARGAVDYKGELLEREETDAERKDDVPQGIVRSEHRIYICDEEIIVLEIKEDAKIRRDAQNKKEAAHSTGERNLSGIRDGRSGRARFDGAGGRTFRGDFRPFRSSPAFCASDGKADPVVHRDRCCQQ